MHSVARTMCTNNKLTYKVRKWENLEKRKGRKAKLKKDFEAWSQDHTIHREPGGGSTQWLSEYS